MSELSKLTRPVAILGAMDSEIERFCAELEGASAHNWNGNLFHLGSIAGRDVVMARSGVGKVLAAMVTQYLIDNFQPSHILFTGIAGSLNNSFQIGDLLVARDTIQHDLDAQELGFERGEIPYTQLKILEGDAKLVGLMREYVPPSGHPVRFGRVLTGDQFFTKSELASHRYLYDELNGDAIEMEGASVATVCYYNRVPCLILRTISDRADGNAAQDFQRFLPLAASNSFDAVRYLLGRMT